MEPLQKPFETNIPKTTAEIIHPLNLPETAFQSYESLRNDASKHKEAFLAGEFRNPEIAYTDLDSEYLEQGIANLHEAILRVEEIEPSEEKIAIISATLEFRAAEMEYVKLLGELNRAVKDDTSSKEHVEELAERVRNLNEQLYGPADKTIRDAALAEVWRQLDSKRLSPSAQQLYNDLKDGFKWNDREVVPLPRPDSAESLPDFNHPSLAWAGEIILDENAEIEAYFRAFWDQQVEEYGEEWVADPEAIVDAYRGAFMILDPANESGVGVQLDPEATGLSWDSSVMAIKVGSKRGPIKTAEDLFKKFLHEGVVHGGRAINGLKTGLPVLGTGLFTDTPRADYLTFEEGFATLIESAVSNDDPKWDGSNLGYYINIAQAADGADFRDVFETAWRYRLLLNLKDDEAIDEAMIEKEQSAAYGAAVRIFKGAPLRLSEKYPKITPLTYNKDLAYLRGRAIAAEHIKGLYEQDDEEGLRKLFRAKYDPTIPEQNAIVEKYTSDGIITR